MAKFGWKYGINTRPGGPDKSIQFNTGSTFSGSAELTFDYATSILSASSAKVHILTASNLLVEGTQTIISSTHLVIQDPMIGLGFGTPTSHTGAVGDRGLVFGLAGDLNQAMIWDQTSGSFIFGKVGSQGPTDSALDILPSNFSTVRVGKLQSIGSISGSSISASGEVFAQTGLRTSGSLNVGSISGASISSSGEIFGQTGLRTSGSLKVANISGSGELFGTSLRTSGSVKVGSVSGSGEIFGATMAMSNTIIATGTITSKNRLAVSDGTNDMVRADMSSGDGRVRVMQSSGVPVTIIDVSGLSGSAGLTVGGPAVISNTLNVTGATSVKGNITSTNGNISTDNGNISVGGAGTWYKGPNGGIAISGYISGSGEAFAQTGLRTSGSLQVANISGSGEVFGTSFRTSGSIQAGSISGSTSINAGGEIIFSNDVSVSGSFTQAGGTSQGSITANGVITANAGVKATYVSASGEVFSQNGLRTSGSLKVANISGSGEVFGTSLRTSGSLQVDNISGSGEVFGTSVRTSGSLQVGKISGSGEIFGTSMRTSGSVTGSAISASTTIQGQISGSSVINHWVVISSGNKNLTAAESGKMIFMAAQTTASLPSPDTIGLNYHIIASQGFSNNPIKITASSPSDDLFGSFISADGGTNDTADNAYDGIQFTSASVRGDSLTIASDGSKWFVRGVSQNSGAIQYQTGPNP